MREADIIKTQFLVDRLFYKTEASVTEILPKNLVLEYYAVAFAKILYSRKIDPPIFLRFTLKLAANTTE